jgi:hypothetical protein
VNVGGGAPVGWFPLGPRDVYCPPYRVSRSYFSNVNVTNIHTSVNTTVINNYYDNVQVNHAADNRFVPDYAYRNRPEATTVVSHDVFAGARPVAAARINVDARQLAAAPLSFQSPAVPNRASFGVRASATVDSRPLPSAVFNRGPVMRATAPPAFGPRQPQPASGFPGQDRSSYPSPGGRDAPPPSASPAAPRNSPDAAPRFEQRPPVDHATPEQRTPMPTRPDDDRMPQLPQRPQPQMQPRPQAPVQPQLPQQAAPRQLPRPQPLPPQPQPQPQQQRPQPRPQPAHEAPPKEQHEHEHER